MEKTIQRCLDEMKKSNVERIALFGATEVARILMGLLDNEHLSVAYILDSQFEGCEFHGVPVLNQEDVHMLSVDAVLITSLDPIEKLDTQLKIFGIDEKLVWRLP